MIKILHMVGLTTRKRELNLQEEISGLKEVRFNSNKLQAWAKKVKRPGACDCCNHNKKEDLEAHHLWSKSQHPTLAYEKDNGVVLCNKCHREFHEMFSDNEFISPVKYEMFKKLKASHTAERDIRRVHAEIEETKKNRELNIINSQKI